MCFYSAAPRIFTSPTRPANTSGRISRYRTGAGRQAHLRPITCTTTSGRDGDKKNYEGLFGWKGFRTDGCRKIDDTLVIIEVKKITKGSEYGYWHAFSQGLIYSYQQQHQSGNDFLVLCIILDWGRAAGQKLSEREKRFLNLFREQQIYFLRVNMIEKQFIEHNINTDWASIE